MDAIPTQPTRSPARPGPGSDVGFLHSVETGAAVDGPGMRFVYFLNGCMFRCLYCHNPDTWKIGGGRRISLAEAVAEIAPYARVLRRAGGPGSGRLGGA